MVSEGLQLSMTICEYSDRSKDYEINDIRLDKKVKDIRFYWDFKSQE